MGIPRLLASLSLGYSQWGLSGFISSLYSIWPPLWVSLTWVLESNYRTLAEGQSTLSRDFIDSRNLAYLTVEGVITAVCLLASWVRFLGESHCNVILPRRKL